MLRRGGRVLTDTDGLDETWLSVLDRHWWLGKMGRLLTGTSGGVVGF